MDKDYKILIVEKESDKIKSVLKCNKYSIKREKESKAKDIINNESLDFIYCTDKKIMKRFSNYYILLPTILKKFAINKEKNNTYVNVEFMNKFIFDNIKIIDKCDSFSEWVIACILYEVLCKNEEKVQIEPIIMKMQSLSGKKERILRKLLLNTIHKKVHWEELSICLTEKILLENFLIN